MGTASNAVESTATEQNLLSVKSTKQYSVKLTVHRNICDEIANAHLHLHDITWCFSNYLPSHLELHRGNLKKTEIQNNTSFNTVRENSEITLCERKILKTNQMTDETSFCKQKK